MYAHALFFPLLAQVSSRTALASLKLRHRFTMPFMPTTVQSILRDMKCALHINRCTLKHTPTHPHTFHYNINSSAASTGTLDCAPKSFVAHCHTWHVAALLHRFYDCTCTVRCCFFPVGYCHLFRLVCGECSQRWNRIAPTAGSSARSAVQAVSAAPEAAVAPRKVDTLSWMNWEDFSAKYLQTPAL